MPESSLRIDTGIISASRTVSEFLKDNTTRFSAALLIAVLVSQVFFFGPARRTSAKSAPVVPPPVSAPPEPFVVGGSTSLMPTIVGYLASFGTIFAGGAGRSRLKG